MGRVFLLLTTLPVAESTESSADEEIVNFIVLIFIVLRLLFVLPIGLVCAPACGHTHTLRLFNLQIYKKELRIEN